MRKHLQYLTDLFNGADGGMGFVYLRTRLDALAERDDDASEELRLLIRRFVRLVQIYSTPG